MAAPPIKAGRVHRFWLIKTKSPETCSISGKMYVVARMKPPKNVKAPAMVRAMPAALVDRIFHHPTSLPDGPRGRNLRFGFQETY